MANFWKIYSGDYSKEGYDSGIDDAKNKRAKNKFKFFKAVNPINYVWNFNNAYDSFMQNYNEGYLDGQRVVNEVYTTTKTKGAGMDKNSYEYHLKLIEDFERKLNSLKVYLDNISQQYQKQINAMGSAGFNTNYTDTLKDRYLTFKNKIDNLQELIDTHKQKIGLHEEALEDLINSARG